MRDFWGAASDTGRRVVIGSFDVHFGLEYRPGVIALFTEYLQRTGDVIMTVSCGDALQF
jgi:hypothetical protein